MAYAAVNGQGDGPPLLLLHGGGGPVSEKWISYFSPQFRVIAMEQMGYGRTADVMDRSFHYHDMAEDTVELMRQLGIESAGIFGYSDGGIIGLDIAIHHSERVTKLALTGVNFHTDGYTEDHWKAVAAAPDAWPASEAYRRLSPNGAHHWPILLGRLQRMWAVEPNYTRDAIRRIAAPTLIVVGDRDLVTVEHALEMFRTIHNSQLCVIPHAGHGVLPKDMILTFLTETVSGST